MNQVTFLSSLLLHGLVFLIFLFSDSYKEITPIEVQINYRHSFGKSKISTHATLAQHQESKANSSPPTNSSNTPKSTDEAITISGTDHGIRAHYPRLSRVLGESGPVQIALSRNIQGSLEKPTIASSSGFPRLDQAALHSVQEALNRGLLAAQLDSQKSIRINFIFKLK